MERSAIDNRSSDPRDTVIQTDILILNTEFRKTNNNNKEPSIDHELRDSFQSHELMEQDLVTG